MAQDQSEIKRRLRTMLAEANRKKNRHTMIAAACACLVGLFTIGLVYDFLTDQLDFGGFMAGLLGCAMGLVSLIPFAYVEERVSGATARRLAASFREAFPQDSGDYATALALLKSAKSESKVEVDLIKGLDEDIQIGDTAAAGTTKSKSKSKSGPGLLGGFDDLKPGKHKTQKPKPSHMPLDPYGADENSGAA